MIIVGTYLVPTQYDKNWKWLFLQIKSALIRYYAPIGIEQAKI